MEDNVQMKPANRTKAPHSPSGRGTTQTWGDLSSVGHSFKQSLPCSFDVLPALDAAAELNGSRQQKQLQKQHAPHTVTHTSNPESKGHNSPINNAHSPSRMKARRMKMLKEARGRYAAPTATSTTNSHVHATNQGSDGRDIIGSGVESSDVHKSGHMRQYIKYVEGRGRGAGGGDGSDSAQVWEPPSLLLQKRSLVVLQPHQNSQGSAVIGFGKLNKYQFNQSGGQAHGRQATAPMLPMVQMLYFPLELRRRDYLMWVLDLVAAGTRARIVQITRAHLYPHGLLRPIGHRSAAGVNPADRGGGGDDSGSTGGLEEFGGAVEEGEGDGGGDALPLLEQLLGSGFEPDKPRAMRARRLFAEELRITAHTAHAHPRTGALPRDADPRTGALPRDTDPRTGALPRDTDPRTGALPRDADPRTGALPRDADPRTGALPRDADPRTGALPRDADPRTGALPRDADPRTGALPRDADPRTGALPRDADPATAEESKMENKVGAGKNSVQNVQIKDEGKDDDGAVEAVKAGSGGMGRVACRYQDEYALSEEEVRLHAGALLLLGERRALFRPVRHARCLALASSTPQSAATSGPYSAPDDAAGDDLGPVFEAARNVLECFVGTGGAVVEAVLGQLLELEAQATLHAQFQKQRLQRLQWTEHLGSVHRLQAGTAGAGAGAVRITVQSERDQAAVRTAVFSDACALLERMRALLRPAEEAHSQLIVRLESYALDVQRMLSSAVAEGDYLEAERLSRLEYALHSSLDADLNRDVPSETDYGLPRLDMLSALSGRADQLSALLGEQEARAVAEGRFQGEEGAQRAAELARGLEALRDRLCALLVKHSVFDALPPELVTGSINEQDGHGPALLGTWLSQRLGPRNTSPTKPQGRWQHKGRPGSPTGSDNPARPTSALFAGTAGGGGSKPLLESHKPRPCSAPAYRPRLKVKSHSPSRPSSPGSPGSLVGESVVVRGRSHGQLRIDSKRASCLSLLVLRLPGNPESLLSLMRRAGNHTVFRHICRVWFEDLPRVVAVGNLGIGSDPSATESSGVGNSGADSGSNATVVARAAEAGVEVMGCSPAHPLLPLSRNITALIITFLQALAAEANEAKDTADDDETAPDVRRYSAQELAPPACTPGMLRAAGYSVLDLRRLGVGVSELAGLGYTLRDLREGGCGFSELYPQFPLAQLREAGFSVAQFRSHDITLFQTIEVGFSPAELRVGGYEASQLYPLFPLHSLKAAGFGVQQLRGSVPLLQLARDGGFTLPELRAAGFSLRDLHAMYAPEELRALGWCRCCITPPSRAASCSQVVALAAADELLYSADTAGEVRVWQLRPRSDSARVRVKPLRVWRLGTASRRVRALYVHGDSRAYASFDSAGVVVYDAGSAQELGRLSSGVESYGATALLVIDTFGGGGGKGSGGTRGVGVSQLLYVGHSAIVRIWDVGDQGGSQGAAVYREVGALVKAGGATAPLLALAASPHHPHPRALDQLRRDRLGQPRSPSPPARLLFAAYGDGGVRGWDLASGAAVLSFSLQRLRGASAASFRLTHRWAEAETAAEMGRGGGEGGGTLSALAVCCEHVLFAGFPDGRLAALDLHTRAELPCLGRSGNSGGDDDSGSGSDDAGARRGGGVGVGRRGELGRGVGRGSAAGVTALLHVRDHAVPVGGGGGSGGGGGQSDCLETGGSDLSESLYVGALDASVYAYVVGETPSRYSL